HQDQGAVSKGDAFGSPEVLVEDGPKAELLEQSPDDKDRPPVGGIDDLGHTRFAGINRLAREQPLEFGEDRDEEILAAQIGDDALFDLAVVAIGFDDADVLVDGTVFGANPHGSWIHDESLGSLEAWELMG